MALRTSILWGIVGYCLFRKAVKVNLSSCTSASNRIIGATDHASIQINFALLDPTTGRVTGQNKTYAICGQIRRNGESDDCLTHLAERDNLISKAAMAPLGE